MITFFGVMQLSEATDSIRTVAATLTLSATGALVHGRVALLQRHSGRRVHQPSLGRHLRRRHFDAKVLICSILSYYYTLSSCTDSMSKLFQVR